MTISSKVTSKPFHVIKYDTMIDARRLAIRTKSIFQPLSQREAAMNITRVPLLVILVVVVVLAQHASIIIMSSGGSSDGGHHGTG
jgi:hypothetical protein